MTREDIALHEAAHAVVAMRLGLHVAWVTCDPGYDEDRVYSGAVKIPDETIDLERDMLAICQSMLAPTFVTTTDRDLSHYVRMERALAYEKAGQAGIDLGEYYDDVATLVNTCWGEICDLADRLVSEGTVVLDGVRA